jgi:mRNA-degrading endonuclease RelE of RelBE toxin-antitoxin system
MIYLTPRAEAQLRELPERAARKIARSLRLLESVPNSGRPYPRDSPFAGSFYKNVVVRSRRWVYRVTYDVVGDDVWVRYLHPSWYPMAHATIASAPPDPADDG